MHVRDAEKDCVCARMWSVVLCGLCALWALGDGEARGICRCRNLNGIVCIGCWGGGRDSGGLGRTSWGQQGVRRQQPQRWVGFAPATMAL